MTRVLIVGAVAMFGMTLGAEARVLSAPQIPAGVVAKAAPDVAEKVACGSRGGPGYRKSNGKCASWRR
ncbi:hypothetical protein V5F38_04950 [Xanthobacter sp. V0B-10]|uniref:hypothetical protein n=1 Tax=Xanthobacter albus TaxID=3119929 RepID=UPI0037273750